MVDNSKVLVVDDVPSNLEIITEVLLSVGYQVATAISGERAINRLQKYIPDLILLDIKMPGIDGFETFRQIKSKPGLADIPVIFITAYADTESIVKGFSLGAVDYISKPFQELELIARVKTHIQLRQTILQVKQQAIQEKVLRQIVENIHCSLDLGVILHNAASQIKQQMEADYVLLHHHDLSVDSQVIGTTQGTDPISSTPLKLFSSSEADSPAPLTQLALGMAGSKDQSEAIFSTEKPAMEDGTAYTELHCSLFLKENLWGVLIAGFRSEKIVQGKYENTLQVVVKQLEIAIQQAHLHHQLELANAELDRLASLDELTQLPNRRCFNIYLEQEWLRLLREQQPLSLIMIDIDYFKLYNDTYGHCQGDICLKAVAETLSKIVRRPADLVARYGGEEFVAILPHTSAAGAKKLAVQMLRAVQQLQIAHRTHLSSDCVTVSLGVTTCIPTLEGSYLAFLDCADQALYQAKSKGRDSYHAMNFSV